MREIPVVNDVMATPITVHRRGRDGTGRRGSRAPSRPGGGALNRIWMQPAADRLVAAESCCCLSLSRTSQLYGFYHGEPLPEYYLRRLATSLWRRAVVRSDVAPVPSDLDVPLPDAPDLGRSFMVMLHRVSA